LIYFSHEDEEEEKSFSFSLFHRVDGAFYFPRNSSKNFNIQPRYIGLFAIQGTLPIKNYSAVGFDWFAISSINCDQ